MGRYIGPVCKLCRYEGKKLFLKGERCLVKCTLDRRKNPSGLRSRFRKTTDYGKRLREKQRARHVYGLRERHFRRYFEMAERMHGVGGENLLQLVERRLDNTVYRLGFALSRKHARQLTLHRHVFVNGRIINIPSYSVQVGDVIELDEEAKATMNVQQALEITGRWSVPSWLERDVERVQGRVVALPTRDQIDTDVEENLIVEFYSR